VSQPPDIVTRVPLRIVPVPSAFYGHSEQLCYFDTKRTLDSHDGWWNSFLLNVDGGFKNMETMLEDQFLENYVALIKKYFAAGASPIT
jgi:hypothetical protein